MSAHRGAIIGGSSGQCLVSFGGALILYRLPKEMNPLVLTLNEKFCIMMLQRVEMNPLVLTLNEKFCIMILQRVEMNPLVLTLNEKICIMML